MDHHRPRMLKDFLNEKISNSCSSNNNGFKSSLPKKPSTSTSMRTLIETDLNSNSNYSNPGIGSKTRSSKSPLQTVLNAVKAVSFFTAVKKSPHAVVNNGGSENKSTVKVKDVVRWKLCRDRVAEEPPSTLAAAAVSCSSSGWSCWSDESDLSSWEREFEDAGNDVVADFEFSLFCLSPLGGEDYVGAATGLAKVGNKILICQEEEQRSPISVLKVGEDEFSPFDQSLANNQRRNQTYMQHIQKIETLEKLDPAKLEQCVSLEDSTSSGKEYDSSDDNNNADEEDWAHKRARELLHYVKSNGSMQGYKANLDKVMLDILRDELESRRNQARNDGDFELDILRIAEDWIDREHDNKDAYIIKDMDWRRKWGRFEEEQEELVLEIETTILHSLIVDLMGVDCQWPKGDKRYYAKGTSLRDLIISRKISFLPNEWRIL